MSLIKIPFLLALTTCVHLAINPPNRATKTEHYTPKNVSWRTAEFALGIVFSMFPVINTPQVIYWLVTICECATILASRSPRSLLATTSSPTSPSPPPALTLSSPSRSPPHVLPLLQHRHLRLRLRLLCYREMGKMFTFELAQRQDHKLITTGPYSIVRHPSYTGSVLAFAGSAVCLLGRNSWMWESGALGTAGGCWCRVLAVGHVRADGDSGGDQGAGGGCDAEEYVWCGVG
ncbi:hypothetical protein BDZ89DRAFT_187014 [Hymenopellis radicata]|nr:hypothetical protein BDZ89DRAFT_187014 [Hymenopellis radicata]